MTHNYKSHGIAEWSDTYKCTQCGDTVTYAAEDGVSAERANELNGDCSVEFKFEQIEDMLGLEEACTQLVHISKCVQNTHTDNSAQSLSAQTMRSMFESRKAGILALLNVIELYVWQKPLSEKKD